ncbi:MAG: DUF1643 domain-containing protein [Oscillospiraceae bacterium]|nr:DUF1643 domain-containing protein [Oscillospiraceae bacterium]
MHIPSADTAALDILSFDEALRQSRCVGYDRLRWLYVPDFYTEYRYVLGTRGEKPVICAGVNPSTAEPDRLDPTLQSVSRIAAANGFDSFLMFNVYAQRATRPDDMDRVRNERLHEENRKAFRALLSMAAESGARPVVWAAWGAVIEKRPWLTDCVRDFRQDAAAFDADWVCAARLRKAGHPHHPLYLRKDEVFRPFDIGGYLT